MLFTQRFAAKRVSNVSKSLNNTKRHIIGGSAFRDLLRISPFTVPHDFMEWVVMNIDTDKREMRYNSATLFYFF